MVRERKCSIPHRVFGNKIDVSQTEVPEFLEQWLSALERDIDVEGIFRVNASAFHLQTMRTTLDRGEPLDASQYGPHDWAGIVKLYFRELVEPMFPIDLYDCIIPSALTKQGNEPCDLEKIQKAINLLPCGHTCVLYRLLQFLNLVVTHSYNNKMTAENLAIVFAPCLFRHPLENTSMEAVVSDFPLQIKFISSLITNFREVFEEYVPGQASAATMERVNAFKKVIEDKYVGKKRNRKEFTLKMKTKYASLRTISIRASPELRSTPLEDYKSMISAKYEKINSGEITYEETSKLLDLLMEQWHAMNTETAKGEDLYI